MMQIAKHPFQFTDNTLVVDVYGLIAKLQSISEYEFETFVTPTKHDFANWVQQSLHNEKLARLLLGARSKAHCLAVLQSYVRNSQNKMTATPPSEQLYPSEFDETKFTQDHSIVNETVVEPLEIEPVEPVQTAVEEIVTAQKSTVDAIKKEPDAPIAQKAESHPVSEGEIKHEAEGKSDTISLEKINEYSTIMNNMKSEIHKIFIGQEEVVNQTVLSILCQAHLLMEGVPGLAKSLLVEMLGRTVEGTKFNRIQFLPDMLPSDVIGGQIYNPKSGEFTINKGPIFANFLLADEINRAPPKTHAALMEAMAERKINIDKEEFELDPPFLVIATQNPLENKGTYELPEAVLDRFMFKVVMEYPKRDEELMIIGSNNTTSPERKRGVKAVCNKEKILEMQMATRKVFLSDRIKEYILNIVEATRGINKKIEGIKFVKYGAGPRATIALAIGSRAQALMEGRNYVLPSDVNAVSKSILRHRVSLNFKGKAYGISADKIVEEILTKVTEN